MGLLLMSIRDTRVIGAAFDTGGVRFVLLIEIPICGLMAVLAFTKRCHPSTGCGSGIVRLLLVKSNTKPYFLLRWVAHEALPIPWKQISLKSEP